ncbi:Zn-ribbon domain-containing OB-fold protein [Hyperthermus butylicus]|uniref:Conserved archaeal protein n=1 Tax=Hyperthermus butylicus (strain DSM 5456 / JCM 9403 / PLM1-5) TaxID=415426 RepID=A2BMZ0_HYPBU|nr:Zn-ribbon domain-containing OB-fold protein [Hyperthermus butylicus]ABM81351.1 conserved archaeal protein [Hyperthermus butylicus DSM 5456]
MTISMHISPARIWRERIYRYRLVGRKCLKCGRTHYPPRPACPHCGSRDLKEVELPRTGVLETYTVIYTVMDGFREKAPLVIGIVRLDDGTRVLAPITDVEPSEVKTGMRVEAVLRRIRKDGEDGLIGYGTAFRPVLSAKTS